VQQPHWPCGLHPSLGERMPRRSRRTSRSEAPSSWTSTSLPSTRNRNPTRGGYVRKVTEPVSRRTFLAAGAGLLVAAACGRTGKSHVSSGPSTTGSTTRSAARSALSQPSDLMVVMASAQLIAGRDNRVTVGIFRKDEYLPADVPVQL